MERRNNSTLMKGKGKRPFECTDNGDEEEVQFRFRRNGPASVTNEAQKPDCPHCSHLEPMIGRMLDEKLGPLAKLIHGLIGRSSPQQTKGPDVRNLQLHFKSRIALPLYTERKVEGEQGAGIHVELIDANTGHIVTSGPESFVKLDLVVLQGDFNNEDDEGWSQEAFDSHVVKERDGKRPLLFGNLHVALKEGAGTLGHLVFTDNSSWTKSGKFRLGLKVSPQYSEDVCIREAMTEAFTVKDQRGEGYQKHYPPALNDEVWRLAKIRKDGSFHKRLHAAGIHTVEDFLRLFVRDSSKLGSILNMRSKGWDILIKHARTCVLSEKLYVYYPDNPTHVAVIFNNIYELSGLVENDTYIQKDSLSDDQKVDVNIWVKEAYENSGQIFEYDGKTKVNFDQTKNTSNSDLPLVQVNYPHTSNNQFQPSGLPVSLPFESSSMDHTMLYGGYNDTMTPQLMNFDSCSQFGPAYLAQQANITNQIASTSYGIDIRSSTQQLHGKENNIGDTSVNVPEYSINWSSFITTPPGFSNVDGPRIGDAVAVAGWLKIKAAMRWGIFIRKKAAEKRARLVELDNELYSLLY